MNEFLLLLLSSSLLVPKQLQSKVILGIVKNWAVYKCFLKVFSPKKISMSISFNGICSPFSVVNNLGVLRITTILLFSTTPHSK